MEWYYTQHGERQGPVDVEELKGLVAKGDLTPDDMVWNQSMGEQWSKISDVPIFGVSSPDAAVNSIETRMDMDKKIEERKTAQAAAVARTKIKSAAILAGIVAVIALAVVWTCGKEKRALGISSGNPLGTVEKLELRLIDTEQRDKSERGDIPFLLEQPASALRYDKPKVTSGKHISKKGSVTLLLDGDGKVTGILAEFTSSGSRGGAMLNKTITEVFIRDIWMAMGGDEKPPFGATRKDLTASDKPTHGLDKIPPGRYSHLEKGKVRGIWLEMDPDSMSSRVYLSLAE